MSHQHGSTDETEQFWEEHYSREERVWSGRANEVLVAEVEHLEPGLALDLGCGEGGDAVWLATEGWQVVAVDVSPTALSRAAQLADDAGVADQIELQAHDLADWRPDREFDLVSAQFLHSPVPLDREDILRAAASAVRVGGTLLIVGHADLPPWAADHHDRPSFPSAAEVLDTMALVDGHWQVERCEESPREATGPEGQTGTLHDAVLHLRRLR